MPPAITNKITAIAIQAAIERPPWLGLKNQRQADRKLLNVDRHHSITRLESAGYQIVSLPRSDTRIGDSRIRIAPPMTTPRATSQVIGQPASLNCSTTHAWISSTEYLAALDARMKAAHPSPIPEGSYPVASLHNICVAATYIPAPPITVGAVDTASRRHRRYSCSGVPRHPMTMLASMAIAANQIHRFIRISPRPQRAASTSSPGSVSQEQLELQALLLPATEELTV